ncbi:carbohydrate kinase family protein [Clostridium guangxiense]|uniref:carbohydrate kinase family protein n=1 Tax=Clostridium guangxiense TaxID=1662055 RepID=UPI001E62E4C7|nr:sugar kinase [Clostridium guangxiense]MCD2348966.1 sugar kinase [Clostridium guangxiense]
MFKFEDNIMFKEKENDVLTVGELLIDMISAEYGEEFQSDSYNKFFGGSPANIAMNVKKLGINSCVVSAVGKDNLGKFLIKKLENADISTDYVDMVDYSTSLVLVTKSKATPIPIFYRGADYHLHFSCKIAEIVRKSKIVHFSCWPISRKHSRETILRIIEECRKNDIIIGFDPNYHKMIWDKNEDGTEYVKDIISKVDIIKPSEDDAERIFGSDTPENQVNKFLELGAKFVVMTLGEDGAIASNGNETVRFNTLATEVVDTTGAGDAFWSGFYTAIIKGYNIKKALELGFAVSAYKLKYTGAVVEFPTIEKVKDMYNL